MSTNLKFKVRKVVSTIGWIYGISWRMLALIGMWYLLISLYVAIRFQERNMEKNQRELHFDVDLAFLLIFSIQKEYETQTEEASEETKH